MAEPPPSAVLLHGCQEGSLAPDGENPHVSQASDSKQIHELESVPGEKPFKCERRNGKLTETGRIAIALAPGVSP